MGWIWRYAELIADRGWTIADLASATGWSQAALRAPGPDPALTLAELGAACAELGCEAEALVGFCPDTPEAQAAQALASNLGYWSLLAHTARRSEAGEEADDGAL